MNALLRRFNVLAYLFPLLILLLYSSAIALVFNERFGRCVLFAVLAMSLLLYIGTFMSFSFGIVLVFISMGCLWAVALHLKLNGGGLGCVKDNIITPGLIVFLLIYTLFYLYDFNRFLMSWDDFSHWAVMAREILRLDSFYNSEGNILQVHHDYPPLVSLFEAFICRISCGPFSESQLFQGLHIMVLALILFPVDAIRATKKNICIVVFYTVVAYSFCFFADTSDSSMGSLYVDIVFGVMIFVVIYASVFFAFQKPFDFALYGMLLASLLLVKQMGIAFYALSVGALALRFFCWIIKGLRGGRLKRFSLQVAHGRRRICIAVGWALTLLIPVALCQMWDMRIADLGIVGQFDVSKIKISDLLNLQQMSAESPTEYSILKQFGLAVLTHGLYADSPSTFLQITLCSIIVLLLVAVLVAGHKGLSGKIIQLTIVLAVGAAGYIVALGLLYAYAFDVYEGQHLASFGRYLSSYVLAMQLLCITVICYKGLVHAKMNQVIGLTFSVLAMMLVCTPSSLCKRIYHTLETTQNDSYAQEAAFIEEQVDDSSASVYLIQQNGDGGRNVFLNYYLYPHLTNMNSNFSFTEAGEEEATAWDKSMTTEEFQELIEPYDYLYLNETDEEFETMYGGLFAAQSLESKQLFKIEQSEEGIQLTYIDALR